MNDNVSHPQNDEHVPIPRNRLFVLVDGTFVVRWSEMRVQELESGVYRPYTRKDYGAPITDYELQQLQKVGLIDSFDQDTIVLHPLAEYRNNNTATRWEADRVRSYYLNTRLEGSLLDEVIALLEEMDLTTSFDARIRDDYVVLRGNRGISFSKFDEAEKARLLLVQKAPDAFASTVIAFIETTRKQ